MTPSPYADWIVRLALWTICGMSAITAFLLVLALVLGRRVAARERRWAKARKLWAPLLVESLAGIPRRLPSLDRREVFPVLVLWNYYHALVRGPAKRGLNALARATGLDRAARRIARRGSIQRRLFAVTALGNLGDRTALGILTRLSACSDPFLSLTAACAMVRIDDEAAMPHLTPLLARRSDWPPARVTALLKEVRQALLAGTLATTAESAPPHQSARLVRYLHSVDCGMALPAVRRILERAEDAGTVAACLDFVGHFAHPEDLPAVRARITHTDWVVRVRATEALGKIGTTEDETLLLDRLSDPQWWVRYRAAKALGALPSVSLARLQELRTTHPDRYARDILAQVIAEPSSLLRRPSPAGWRIPA